MTFARDIFAVTNPAYTSLVLASFIGGYTERSPTGPQIPLAFLPLPLVLSERMAQRFSGTNVTTGLLAWANRNPDLQLEYPDAVRRTASLSRAAIIFGIQSAVLNLDEEARLTFNLKSLKRSPKDEVGVRPTQRVFSLAHRFGSWCGEIASPSMVFLTLGIQP